MARALLRTSAVVTAAALCAGLASAPASAAAGRGTLVSAEHLRTLSSSQVAGQLATAGFRHDSVRNGVDTYRLVYRTIDAHGRPTTASGLFVLPRTGRHRLRTVSFDHGTTSYKGDAPSTTDDGFAPAPALTYGAAGFAAAEPDYLGLGLGPGVHPWMDVPSEVTASVDMLRAARAFTRHRGRELDRKVMVTGFSQGASAATALGRALQNGSDPWFRLGALAPVSGGYAFRTAEIPALLGGEVEPKSGTLYAAYLLVAFNRLHHLYDSPAQVFKAPYDETIEQLFDGTHTGEELFNGTPGTISDLLTPDGLQLLKNPPERFAAALRVLDGTCTWTPKAPTRLYFSRNDEQAVNANSTTCRTQLGKQVPLIDLGTETYQGSRHLGSNVAGTAAIVRWFLTLK
ncbi:hypothetical protein [Actinomadura rayongensis]|uniref:hypothetical protein n=1 Tax=Actinomadura rayongensis TaxID=1429076 RepID=UPI0019276BE3|nr:hypothetical protein [Actinomadura rayongensis]